MGVEIGLRSEREDKMRVDAAAPAAAETPATIARVIFDMANSESSLLLKFLVKARSCNHFREHVLVLHVDFLDKSRETASRYDEELSGFALAWRSVSLDRMFQATITCKPITDNMKRRRFVACRLEGQ